MDFSSVIQNILQRKHLTMNEAQAVLHNIMKGVYTSVQIAALLVALRMKGESAEEIAGFALEMRRNVKTFTTDSLYLVDTCGTGGDQSGTFNISTASAFVASGAGIKIAKHGNRSVSSRCGSADVLEELGVKIDASVDVVEKCLKEVGIAFFFAPLWHPSMKDVAPIRKELGIRTIFNILGPLVNPLHVSRQVLGVCDKDIGLKMAEALLKLGSERAFIVHGRDGLDEVTLTTSTTIIEIRNGKIQTWAFNPSEFGYSLVNLETLKGEGASQNAAIIRQILEGQDQAAKRDIVVINAAFAILASGLVRDLNAALVKAKDSIQSGKALEKLNQLIKVSQG